jgi:predicted O-methyltransferase YrrM
MERATGDLVSTARAVEPSEILEKVQIPPENRQVSIRAVEGRFLRRWVEEHNLHSTLEIGLAYGTSAAWIASAHSGTHTCIDPFQAQSFDNLGLKNLETLGLLQRVEFHQGFSHEILPRLLAEKRTYDFAFIDGSHLYDSILLDFFYVDRMLMTGGYVVFHDAWMRSTQLVASFVRRNRRDYQEIRTPERNLILFRKVGRDERKWYHFREFYTLRRLLSYWIIVWSLRHKWLARFRPGQA